MDKCIADKWYETKYYIPKEDKVVETKIHDEKGKRNLQLLFRKGNLWFHADGSIYVYYTPTHWRTVFPVKMEYIGNDFIEQEEMNIE